jgi:hypothetical protein
MPPGDSLSRVINYVRPRAPIGQSKTIRAFATCREIPLPCAALAQHEELYSG